MSCLIKPVRELHEKALGIASGTKQPASRPHVNHRHRRGDVRVCACVRANQGAAAD